MDVPDVLSCFVPRFDTLFLGVKETDPEALTKTDHLLGWLLRVLREDESEDNCGYKGGKLTSIGLYSSENSFWLKVGYFIIPKGFSFYKK